MGGNVANGTITRVQPANNAPQKPYSWSGVHPRCRRACTHVICMHNTAVRGDSAFDFVTQCKLPVRANVTRPGNATAHLSRQLYVMFVLAPLNQVVLMRPSLRSKL